MVTEDVSLNHHHHGEYFVGRLLQWKTYPASMGRCNMGEQVCNSC